MKSLRECNAGDGVTIVMFERGGDYKRSVPSVVKSIGKKWMHVQIVGRGRPSSWETLVAEIETGVVHDVGSWKNHPRVFVDAVAAQNYLDRRLIEQEVSTMIREGWRLPLSHLNYTDLAALRALLWKMKL